MAGIAIPTTTPTPYMPAKGGGGGSIPWEYYRLKLLRALFGGQGEGHLEKQQREARKQREKQMEEEKIADKQGTRPEWGTRHAKYEGGRNYTLESHPRILEAQQAFKADIPSTPDEYEKSKEEVANKKKEFDENTAEFVDYLNAPEGTRDEGKYKKVRDKGAKLEKELYDLYNKYGLDWEKRGPYARSVAMGSDAIHDIQQRFRSDAEPTDEELDAEDEKAAADLAKIMEGIRRGKGEEIPEDLTDDEAVKTPEMVQLEKKKVLDKRAEEIKAMPEEPVRKWYIDYLRTRRGQAPVFKPEEYGGLTL